MGTDYKKAPLSDYSVHKVAEEESGFNYYGYVHSSGQVIIMREEIATGNILYADGGFNLISSFVNRENLDYKIYSKI